MSNVYGASIAKGKKWTDELKAAFDQFDKKARLPLVLKNVYVYYLQHKEGGVPKYGEKGTTLLEKEYPVQILITKQMYKQLKKLHKKTAVKEYDAEEFEKNFKCKPPYIDVNDEYLVIRLGNNAGYKDRKSGNIEPLSAPKVVNSFKESLAETSIGNGSLATIGISLTPYVHETFGKGTSLNFGLIKITELVEYVSSDNEVDDEDDFDFDENPDAEDNLDSDGGDLDDDLGATDDEDKTTSELAEEQLAAQAAAQATPEASDDDEDEIF